MLTFELLIIFAMILLNSIFAAYEIALASISAGTLQKLVAQGQSGARAALAMKERMEASLAVVQMGITLVGATAAATGGAGAEESLQPLLERLGLSEGISQILSIAVVVAILTAVTILFGELIPKVFALRNKVWVCLTLSPPMLGFSYAVWPAVWILERIVTAIMRFGERGSDFSSADQAVMQEVHGAAAVARMASLIGHREEGIIVSATRLASTPIQRIMLPAEYIDLLSVDQTLSEALISAHTEMHTRFPVTEERGNPQRIIGYVNFKDLVSALRTSPRDPTVRGLIRKIPFFHSSESVANVLENLMRDHIHIALIRGKDQSVIGMVTMEDIVEELVGEIHDEYDRMPSHLNATGTGWIAGGFVPLNRIRDETGIDLITLGDKPIYTLSDWIVDYLGRPPRGGDQISTDHCEISVRKVRHILVQEAFLQKVESSSGSSEESRPENSSR